MSDTAAVEAARKRLKELSAFANSPNDEILICRALLAQADAAKAARAEALEEAAKICDWANSVDCAKSIRALKEKGTK